jgi:hypothetical protein
MLSADTVEGDLPMKHCIDRVAPLAVMVLFACAGCSTAYYGMMAKFGKEKRDILVSRVKDARDEQDAAKQQFKTTLQRFQEVTAFQGGDLEAKYKKLNGEYERCEASAKDVSDRIAKVETVAHDMFKEWAQENKEYTDPEKRSTSEKLLRETQTKYDQLIELMKRSELKMHPVLAKFKDNVLFLKHNLNAAAITSLQGTAGQIESDVQGLIKDMEASIAEADAFMKQMK